MLGQAVRGAYYDKTTDAVFGPIGGENKYYNLEEKRQNGGNIITDPSVSTRLGETFMSGFLETLKTLHNRSRGYLMMRMWCWLGLSRDAWGQISPRC